MGSSPATQATGQTPAPAPWQPGPGESLHWVWLSRCPSWNFDSEATDTKKQTQWRIYLASDNNIHCHMTAGVTTNTQSQGWHQCVPPGLFTGPGLG